jgi:hypothetical protein
VIVQFGASVRVFRSFSRIRRARNTFEYPATGTPGPAVGDAIKSATEARDAAAVILAQNVLSPW